MHLYIVSHSPIRNCTVSWSAFQAEPTKLNLSKLKSSIYKLDPFKFQVIPHLRVHPFFGFFPCWNLGLAVVVVTLAWRADMFRPVPTNSHCRLLNLVKQFHISTYFFPLISMSWALTVRHIVLTYMLIFSQNLNTAKAWLLKLQRIFLGVKNWDIVRCIDCLLGVLFTDKVITWPGWSCNRRPRMVEGIS